MEVDPGTPLFTRQLAAQHGNEISGQTPISPNSTRSGGAKIVKSIRPPPRMTRESLTNENGDKGYEFDENTNPFQSKPKIGFDSATSSSSSISNENNSECYLKEDSNLFQTKPGLGRSPSPNRLRVHQEENCPNVNEDEWESHKKRSNNTSRRSNLPCSPTANQSTSVSVVSSTTDLSSSSSISPQETQKENNQKKLTESNDQELNDPFKTPQKNSKLGTRKSLSTTLTENEENSAQSIMENSNHNSSVNTNSSFLPSDCVIFDSIFSNESGNKKINFFSFFKGHFLFKLDNIDFISFNWI